MSQLSSDAVNAAQGERLAAVRNGLQLKQSEFAEQLGVSLRAYINYESGDREMPTALFRSLSDKYRIDAHWLLFGPGNEPVRQGQRNLNLELLKSVIQLVEGHLHRTGGSLSPEKKARLIGLMYNYSLPAGKIDSKQCSDLLSIAA